MRRGPVVILIAAIVLSACRASAGHHANATTATTPTTATAPADPAPLDVAAAFAAAAYTVTPRLDLATTHLQRVLSTLAGLPPDRRPVRAEIIDKRLVDPRSSPAVIQVDVQRTWLDGPGPSVDPDPHIIELTLVREPDGRWLVDDVQV